MTTRSKSEAVKFLEDITGGPLTLGNLLASIRLGEGKSQAEFARQLGISKSHLCDIEKGRKRVSPERAVKFAHILDYSEKQFLRLALQDIVEGLDLELTVQLV